MIFKTITDDITGVNKSIGLFGLSLKDVEDKLYDIQTRGFKESIFNTSNIDIEAINDYNSLLERNFDAQKALEIASKNTNATTIQLMESSNGLTISTERVTAAQKASTVAAKAQSVALSALSTVGNMIAFALIAKGIQLAADAIDHYVNRAKYAAETMEEAQQEIDDSQNTLKNMTTTLSESKDRFLELSQGVDKFSNNLRLSEEDYAEYLSISNQLAELFPSLVSGYDSQGNALLAIGSNATETNEKLQSLLETQRAVAQQTLIDNMDDVANGIYYEVKDSKDSIESMESEIETLQQQYKDFNIDIKNSHGLITFSDEDYSTYGKYMEEALTDAGIEFEKKSSSGLYSTDIQLISASPEQLAKAQEFYDASLETENEYYHASENKLKQNIAAKENSIETSYSKMTANLQAWMKDDANYQYLSDTASSLADALVPEIKWDELEEPPKSAFDYQNYVEENIINPLMEVPQEHKQEIDSMFQELLSFEDGDLDVLPFAEKLQARLKELGIEIDITPIIEDEQEAKDKLQNSIESIAKEGSEDYQKLQEYTKGFDTTQAEAWAEATLGAENATDAINKYEVALSSVSNSTTLEKLESEFEALQTSTISLINSMDSINAAFANSFSGKGLSIDIDEETGELTGDLANLKATYQDLEGYDVATLFEKTANGVHINREALRALQAQQESIQKEKFLEKQKTLQEQLNQAIKERNQLDEGTSDYTSAQAVVDTLQNQLETVKQLSSAYDGATSAYQKWLDAQSNGEDGDMFRNVSETMKERGSELYKEGRYNTEEFRAIADYYSYTDLSTASMEEVVKAYENAADARNRFFTGDKTGIDNFMKEVLDGGFAKELESGIIEFETGTDEAIAERLGLSVEAIQTLIRAATEYSDNIRVGDTSGVTDYNTSLEEMKTKADEAKQKLQELKEESNQDLNLDFNFDSTDIEELDSQIKRAKENLKQFTNEDGQVDLSINGAQDAVTILQTLIRQKQTVSQPEILSVDTSSLDENVANAVSKLQEYQTALNELNTLEELQSIGIQVDSSEIDDAKAKVNGIFSEIQNASEDGSFKINADVSVDSSSQEKLNSDLSAMTPEITAKITPDISSLSLTSEGTTTTVTAVTIGKEDVDALKQAIDDVSNKKVEVEALVSGTLKVSTLAQAINNLKNKTVTITTNKVTTYSENSKGKVTGTMISPARVSGTAYNVVNTIPAYADGKISLSKNEQALVNEMGTESLIRNGRWMLIPGGMHFENLKKGDIVLNSKQTSDLLKSGKAFGTGKAYADGTIGDVRTFAFRSLSAYSDGTWTFGNTGSGNLKGSGVSLPTSSPSPSPSSTSKVEEAADKATDAVEEFFDFVEIKLERATELTEKSIDAIDDAIGLAEKQATNAKAISQIQSEISVNRQAYDKYMAKANSISISDSYKKQIQNGSLNIETITDETLKENLDSYKKWYDQAKECQDAIDELIDKERELAQERLEYVNDYYDLIVQLHESAQSLNDSTIEFQSAMGLSAVSDSVKKVYESSIAEAEAIYERSQEKLADYQAELNDLVSKGYIEKFSDQWYEAMAQINELKQEVNESSVALIEFQDKLREIEYNKVQYIVDGFERAINKLDAQMSLMEARDEKVPESLYQQKIDTNNSIISNNKEKRDLLLEEQSFYDVGSERYQELAEEINSLDTEILELMADNEELKDSISELRFEPLEDGIEKSRDLREEIEDFRGLLNEDAFFDKNGVITEEGLANVALISQGMSVAKQEIADYQEGLEKLQEAYDSGLISETEFTEKSKEYREGIRESIADVQDYSEALTDLYITQMSKENEALKEIIEKRKEALQAKADYYEYDKKIKSQSKDVNMLKSQIAALEGVNNASAQAELKRLKQELAEAEDTLAESKREHSIEMQESGYDQMSEGLDQILEDTTYEIQTNADKQQEIIQSMLNNVVNMYDTAYGKINAIIANTGFVGSDEFNQNQSELNTQSGASNQTSSATQNQSDVTPNQSASGTNTSNINNNDSYNQSVEQEIVQPENTTNRKVAELKVSKTSVSLEEGKSTTVTTSIRPTDATNKTLLWTSSNTSVATVSSGSIKAVKHGSAQIVVATTDGSGISQIISVTVTKKPEPVKSTTTSNSSSSTGGDGIPKVGDAVTFASGQYYYDSQGVSPSGNQNLGKTVYISKINNKSWATKPYHLTSDKQGKHPLGWVALNQLKGYRTGSKGIPADQLAWTDEGNKEEMIIRPSDGAVLTRLKRNDIIANHQLAENIFKWGAINPDIATNLINNSSLPEINREQIVQIEQHYDSMLTVNGNVDKEALPDLEDILKQAYQYTSDKMYKDARKAGFRTR